MTPQQVIDTMKEVGFVVTDTNFHSETDFEVWVTTPTCPEALYLEIRENTLYWWDFTHTTLIGDENTLRQGLQKLYSDCAWQVDTTIKDIP